jgi:hypothetical protein
MNRFCLACLVLSLLWVWATCSKNQGPRTDSETHFLSHCVEGKCGNELECIEQICTRTCETDSDCRDLDEGATCVELKEGCTGTDCQKVCEVLCLGDSDCDSLNEALSESIDESYDCLSGFCRLQGLDAAVPNSTTRKDIPEGGVVFYGETNGNLEEGKIVGDLDGDGLDDFVLFRSFDPSQEGLAIHYVYGSAYLFYGREDFESEVCVVQADAILRDSGILTGTGKCDFDGDGLHDFIVASDIDSIHYPAGLNGAGAYLIYGSQERLSGDQLASEVAVDLLAPTALAQAEPGNLNVFDDRNAFEADCAGDLNGDGLDDFFVIDGDRNSINSSAVTYIVLGRRERLSDSFLLEEADARISGSFGNYEVCHGTKAVGDTDNDGFDDLLFHYCLPISSTYSETALLYGDADRFSNDISPDEADAFWANGWMRGTRGIGDVNQDGMDDIVVGILDNALGIVYGRETRFARIIAESEVDVSVQGLADGDVDLELSAANGDIDGDGMNDLVLGFQGYGEYGALFVVRGSEMPLSSTFVLNDTQILHFGVNIPFEDVDKDSRGENLGSGVSSGGDINGDGYDDILVSAPGDIVPEDYYGRVYLVFGSSVKE